MVKVKWKGLLEKPGDLTLTERGLWFHRGMDNDGTTEDISYGSSGMTGGDEVLDQDWLVGIKILPGEY